MSDILKESKYYFCKLDGFGYDTADQLEIHLRKEHTKTDFIAWLKKEAVNQ